MPYERPSLSSLTQQALADVAVSTGQYGVLRTSPTAAMAKAQAGLTHGEYGYIDWISKQSVPFTADGEYLAGWAGLVKIERKLAAAAAGQATFAGENGRPIPAGTSLIRTGDGQGFVTTAAATVTGGSATVAIAAAEPGAAGNGVSGDTIVLATGVSGVNASGVTAGPITGGADEELDEDLFARMLERYQNPPDGGAASDYERWAKEVPGVTRAWCKPNGFGAGTVVVYVMLDDAQAAHDGFPQGSNGVAADEPRGTAATGDQLTVADHLFPLRPATALVYVVGATAYPVNVEITDLSTDSTAIRAAIVAALKGALRRKGTPKGGTIYTSDFTASIDAVPDVDRFTLLLPSGSVAVPAGSLPVLGTVTWS